MSNRTILLNPQNGSFTTLTATTVTGTTGVFDTIKLDTANQDVILQRDAANVLALRNGTAAQVFNIYNTWTNASNYEKAFIQWNTNVLLIGSQAAGSGSARVLRITTDGGTNYWQFAAGTTLNLLPSADNTYSIGGASNRVANIYSPNVNSSASALALISNSNTGITISTAGAIRFNTGYGVGAIQSDVNGNLTSVSDERLKFKQGDYTDGLASVLKINPGLYKWRPESGMETEHTYAGFSAQNVQEASPMAVGVMNDERGTMSLNDRAVLAMLVNAVKELDERKANR